MAADSANPGARGVAGEQIFLSSNLVPDDGVFYNVNINVSGSRISTMGSYGYGIYGLLGGRTDAISMGDLEITANQYAHHDSRQRGRRPLCAEYR